MSEAAACVDQQRAIVRQMIRFEVGILQRDPALIKLLQGGGGFPGMKPGFPDIRGCIQKETNIGMLPDGRKIAITAFQNQNLCIRKLLLRKQDIMPEVIYAILYG